MIEKINETEESNRQTSGKKQSIELSHKFDCETDRAADESQEEENKVLSKS
jgi:hypothetical protein